MASKNIEAYLENLRKVLNGADPATVQDALSDAEEHLSTALESALEEQPDVKEANALEAIIEAYGSPEETAAAYQDIEVRVQPALASSEKRTNGSIFTRFFGIFGDPKAWGALLYLVSAMGTGIIYFTWAVTGLSLSISFAIFIFGLPFAAFFMVSTRLIGLVEGRLVEALLGVRMPRRPAFFPKELAWQEKLKMAFTSKFTWLVMLYMVLQMPLGIIYFTAFVVLISVSLSFIAAPVIQLIFQQSVISLNSGVYFLPIEYLVLMVILGVLIITSTMHLAKFLGGLHGAYAKKVLVSD